MCLRSVAVTMTPCLLSRGLGWVINFLFSDSLFSKSVFASSTFACVSLIKRQRFVFQGCMVICKTLNKNRRLLLRPSYIQCCNTHDFESALNKCHGVDA